jgi:cytochrome c oxidase cbb3-type subunit III
LKIPGLLNPAIALALILAGMVVAQEQKEPKNPVAGDARAIAQGQRQFVLSCSYCHGVDARGGGRGPDLTSGRWLHGDTDGAIYRTITHGVPGTEMPACGCPEDEAWRLVSFLRSLSARTAAPVTGDLANGEKIFFGSSACTSCHVVKGRGGRFGPDLSRIGASRSVRSLIESIRDPGKVIAEGYETVVAVDRDGKRTAGVRKNEDTFTLQLMDQGEKYHLLQKRDLREVLYDRKSLMPAYDERSLSEKDLRDLVAFLDSLRGN